MFSKDDRNHRQCAVHSTSKIFRFVNSQATLRRQATLRLFAQCDMQVLRIIMAKVTVSSNHVAF